MTIHAESSLQQIVQDAARRPEVTAAVERVYAQLQEQIDLRRPKCIASGRCCHFEDFGHRLYVTSMELAAFTRSLAQRQQQATHAPWDGRGCPFQRAKLCQVHDIRPFGCRIFFCDSTSTQWQHDAYEKFHAELRHLHEQLGVEYRYVEWRFALGELGLAEAAN